MFPFKKNMHHGVYFVGCWQVRGPTVPGTYIMEGYQAPGTRQEFLEVSRSR